MLGTFAGAATLGDPDIRSFIGQPLDVRIPILAARNELIELGCISARAGERTLSPLATSRFKLDETLDSRTLIVRTHDPLEAPRLTLELSVRCDGQSAPVTRVYDLVLPALNPAAPESTVITIQKHGEAPRVVTTAPVQVAPSAPLTIKTQSDAPTQPPSRPGSTWVTGISDTLDGIAQGLYPKSARMRAAFIRRLREINPGPLPGDGETLATGLKLTLPDLVALANQSPRIDPPAADASLPTIARAPSKSAPRVASAAPAPSTSLRPPQPVPQASQVAAPVQPRAANDAPSAKPASPSAGGFALRLSGAEMDISRSKGVSEATRAALRDKQMLLDADDQVAALLALRHTVKQLEGRLNEMQLKLSTSTLPVPAKATPAPEPSPVQKAAPQPPPAASATQSPVPAVIPPPQPARAAAPPPAPSPKSAAEPEAPPVKPKPAPADSKPAPVVSKAPAAGPEAETPVWMSPLALGIGASLLVILLAWVGWRRSRNRGLPRTLAETTSESDAVTRGGTATSDLQGPPSDDFPKGEWDDDPPPAVRSPTFHSSQPSANLRNALRQAEHHETVRLNAPPDLLEAEAAALELDTRPATSIDFMLGDDGGEDKSRRQRYMEERFPELAHHSISVDEPDSIIDAARHHYEEGQLQKAVELLTYAFEERPGQLRFWLALFEIHRLEQRTGDFAELAARFKNVHGGTDAWPKVQHIGRDLDPGQPLYSAALGRLGVPMDADFDPMSENWLNVPMDFTSDVLMIELRHSIMAEHMLLDDELRRPLIEVTA
ncbi:MAG: hypothetical protein JNM76_15420 [Betaproteobacteria bacterium]|nr:hypothetical protein [Betaproteobacteria bacterium]